MDVMDLDIESTSQLKRKYDSMSSSSSSSSSDCSSRRVAPYASRESTPSSIDSDPMRAQKSAPRLTSITPDHEPRPILDDETASRLIQLYTTDCRPIAGAGHVESHFTCHYVTAWNFEDVLMRSCASTESINNNEYGTSSHPEHASPSSVLTMLNNLADLSRRSWRVTPGTIDFLELIWTGRRSHKDWTDIVTRCTCFENDSDEEEGNSGNFEPCPVCQDNDTFLALNLSVTYHYTPSGQPVISLTAIVMTNDVFDAIAEYANSKFADEPQSGLQDGQMVTESDTSDHAGDDRRGVDFRNLPFVRRENLVSVLCGLRNAGLNDITRCATEGRAWSGRSVLKAFSRQSQPAVSSLSSKPSHESRQSLERLATLVPGRDAMFRTVVSRLQSVLDRSWIRRSSQISLNWDNQQRRSRY